MITDAFLGLVATLLEAMLGVLPAWSFVMPGTTAAGTDSSMVSILEFIGPMNGIAPVKEIFVVASLVAALVGALLLVKAILWVVERVFDVIP
jgi:hypothetical protein